MLLSNQNWADMNGVWQCKLQLSLIPRPLLACNRGCHSSEMKSRSGLGMRLCSYVKLLPVVSRREPMFFPPGLEYSHLPHLCWGLQLLCTCVHVYSTCFFLPWGHRKQTESCLGLYIHVLVNLWNLFCLFTCTPQSQTAGGFQNMAGLWWRRGKLLWAGW